MLTFFRKIRKGLLDGGRTSKYLLYAVGEIALVVIGILIALQINNWNEWRIDKHEEQEILTILRQELEANRTHINSNMAWHRDILETSLTLLSRITSDMQQGQADQLIGDMSWFLTMAEFEMAVVEAVIFGGQLTLIQNGLLRNKITSWRQKVELLGKMIDQDYDHFSQDWMPFLRSNTNVAQITNAIKTVPGGEETLYGNDLPLTDQIDHRHILDKREFKNLVVHKIWIQNDILADYEELLSDLNVLIGLVESEKSIYDRVGQDYDTSTEIE